MKRIQAGFTMIELIVVIAILGILAAVAMPKFVDLSTEAKASALAGVAGAANSAMTLNYGGCQAVNNAPTANKCVAVDDCNDIGTVLQGGLPTGYTVANGAVAAPAGTTVSCTLTQTNGGATATFTAIRAGI